MDDKVEFFADAYLEGFEKSKERSYERRKKAAKLYAAELLPEGGVALKAVGMCAVERRVPSTEMEMLGRKIATRLGRLPLKSIHKNGKDVEKKIKDLPGKSCDSANIQTRFEEACKLGFVPRNNILAALLGCSASYGTALRNSIFSDKYEFEKAKYGYIVTPKENEEVVELRRLAEVITARLREIDPKMGIK